MSVTHDNPAIGNAQTVLGFDVGTRVIGVAVGNRLLGTARALATLMNHDGAPDWKRLDPLVREWQPQAFVVGLPLTFDGEEQSMTRVAREFAVALEQRYSAPVHAVDERCTSREASRRFAVRRAQGTARRKDAAYIDGVAAEIILEAWFAENADASN
ncbi:MAG: Holliday junction resolvase RuvX [Rhodanobacteraceae bacterium]